MKISDFVGDSIRFRNKEEVTKFLEVTGLQHPHLTSTDMVEQYRTEGLQIVEGRYCSLLTVNPEFDIESQYYLYYHTVRGPIKEASVIINQLTLKPLDGVDILVLFLKKHRKLTEFKREFSSEFFEGELALEGSNLSRFLLVSFNWGCSKRGFAYWRDLQEELAAMVKYLNLPTITHSDEAKFLKIVKYKSTS